ncbi:hypothetical protein ACPC36_08715 [Streptomyces pseudogriseolus]|uniref:hypothetical protein n=1 Tax=Streptomyces pseudogriseolus TaxID=36817 RepID=UPI003FA297A6
MSHRDLVDRVTAVEHFTAAPDSDKALAAGVRDYARHREGLRGCDGGVTLRLPERPGRYVRMDRWRGMTALLRSTHQRGHLHRLALVTALASAEHELAVSVGSMPAAVPLADASRVVLVRAEVDEEPDRFELSFGALAGQCVTAEGYGGNELLRSVVDPRCYTGLLWWGTAEAHDRALAGPGYRDRLSSLRSTARLTEHRAEPLRGA